jgi:hypothetical protein
MVPNGKKPTGRSIAQDRILALHHGSVSAGFSHPPDFMPFMLTVTLPYVARELGKSVSFAEISKYVEQNADKLKAAARFAKIGRGYTAYTLE